MGLTRGIWEAWKARSRDIGEFQSRAVLTMFYFTVLVPFALLLRLFGDPLRMRRRQTASTWSRRAAADSSLAGARRQF